MGQFRFVDPAGRFDDVIDPARAVFDVEQALQEIIAKRARLDPARAAERVKDLRRAGRYLKDVY